MRPFLSATQLVIRQNAFEREIVLQPGRHSRRHHNESARLRVTPNRKRGIAPRSSHWQPQRMSRLSPSFVTFEATPYAGILRNEIAKRFHALIAEISNVRSTSSASLKCGFTASHTASGT